MQIVQMALNRILGSKSRSRDSAPQTVCASTSPLYDFCWKVINDLAMAPRMPESFALFLIRHAWTPRSLMWHCGGPVTRERNPNYRSSRTSAQLLAATCDLTPLPKDQRPTEEQEDFMTFHKHMKEQESKNTCHLESDGVEEAAKWGNAMHLVMKHWADTPAAVFAELRALCFSPAEIGQDDFTEIEKVAAQLREETLKEGGARPLDPCAEFLLKQRSSLVGRLLSKCLLSALFSAMKKHKGDGWSNYQMADKDYLSMKEVQEALQADKSAECLSGLISDLLEGVMEVHVRETAKRSRIALVLSNLLQAVQTATSDATGFRLINKDKNLTHAVVKKEVRDALKLLGDDQKTMGGVTALGRKFTS